MDNLIDNKQIEEMFYRIATDEDIAKYQAVGEQGYKGAATSHASGVVYRAFMKMLNRLEMELGEPVDRKVIDDIAN
jgi:hypothetical protein